MKKLSVIFFGIAAIAAVSCEKEPMATFENQIYLNTDEKVENLSVNALQNAFVKTFSVAIPQPSETDVDFSIGAAKDYVKLYNAMYGTNAKYLPADYFTIEGGNATISAGTVSSTEISIEFEDLDELETEFTYVLPVAIKKSNIPILEGRNVKYYVISNAGVITTVCDISGNYEGNFVTINWATPSVVQGLKSFTYEILCYGHFDDNDTSHNEQIYSLMGVEGDGFILLRRWGKHSVKSHALEVCGLGGLGPDLPSDKWVHVCVTYEQSTGNLIYYYDGKAVKTQSVGNKKIDVNEGGQFYIGRSYNNDRWWPGMISEARIWNRALSAQEIAEPIHPYSVDFDANGLVCYWKFNEGTGNFINDRTGNGNLGQAEKPLTWVKVDLP